MINVLIADDNIDYVKNLINFVIGKNKNIKITNIASNGFEVLDILKKNNNIDLILLDLKMPKLNGIQTLNKIHKMNFDFPNIIIISGDNYLISKIINYPIVVDFIHKNTSMEIIYKKLEYYEKEKNFYTKKIELERKISEELAFIGYKSSHIGTQYIKECILEIYETSNFELIYKLENYIYKKIIEEYVEINYQKKI